MGVQRPPNQIVAAFLPKVLNQRVPELAEYVGAQSISHLVRQLMRIAIEDMDKEKAAKAKEVLRSSEKV